ncbi:EAL domain-containing protein [Cupriavidus necator]|uniref:EAL domain-containing protein n=1 Tax=Cupriavidus necator TaxID=106590 RepID=A0A367PIG4_CUPNE|nr:EAL domain-containing protein [Cupriavidus necator]QQX86589.1 EAL domain-containing protein [Cupriavidus necator]RCJ06786.1 EAL domain-containing protein [Cupriavidus necator]
METLDEGSRQVAGNSMALGAGLPDDDGTGLHIMANAAPLRTSIKLRTAAPNRLVESEVERLKNKVAECEALLHEHKAALIEAEHMARFGTWTFDLLAKRPDFSDEARRLLGLAHAPLEPTPTDYSANLYAEDRARITEMMRAALVRSKAFDTQIRVVRDDGGLRWLRVIGRPEESGTYRPRRVTGMLFDITSMKRTHMQQRVELAVARLLQGTDPLPHVVGKIIRVVCKTLGWEWGAYWALDESTNRMHLLKGLSIDSKGYDVFAAASQQIGFPSGAGFIGEVFRTGSPRWVSDVTQDATFLRRDAAISAGLRGGFAFPVHVDGKVIGVLEFFSRFSRQPDALLPAISRALGAQIGQFVQRQLSTARIHYLASYDELTGQLNRSQFNERLRQALAQARHAHQRLGLLFIDLDRFKIINDTLGHEAGDVVLQEFAERLRGAFRETDMVARLGGDEFAVLLPQCGDVRVLTELASKVLRTTVEPVQVHGGKHRVSASIGVSMFPDDGVDAPMLLRSADTAMYRAKSQGGNNVQFHSAVMDAALQERLAFETSLGEALDQSELSLAFQPIFQLATQHVIGFEALLRWKHPKLGEVLPSRFIPLAEETGLIHALGSFALRSACEEAARWPAPLTVFVNVSSRQLADGDFPDQVGQALSATGLAAERLGLEITETALMQQQAVPLLEQIRKLGVRLSIDDFGTGYSSLAYLKRLPLDSIKLDQSFVRGLPHDANDCAIARAVIALGHNLKLSIVAEGVERTEQFEYLREANCDAIQGYLLSRPMPAGDVAAWLHKQSSINPGRV